MRTNFLLLLLLTCVESFSQDLTIDYDVRYKESIYKNRLIISDSTSEWRDIITGEIGNQVELFLLKKPSRQLLFFSDFIFGKTFYVMDSLHNMDWNLTNDQKEILGHRCLSAETNFRGRVYTAFYAPELPFSDGPWKFGGLPGIILAISSNDGEYSFIANTLRKTPGGKIAANKNAQHAFINWRQYVEQFKNLIDNTVKMSRAKTQAIDTELKGRLKIDAPEIIVPNAQTGEGIEY